MKKAVLAIIAVSFAVVCSSLGVWQLRRLNERKAQNAILAGRRFSAEIPLAAIGADTAAARFRPVKLFGRYDYPNEFVITLRTRNGSPGVNIITPFHLAGRDTAVLVNRGWVYAPDGMTVDLRKWRESENALTLHAFVETFPHPRQGSVISPGRPQTFRWMDRAAIQRALPYPVAPYYFVLAPDSTQQTSVPPRVEPRSLDEGPHRSYAIQWFSFAAISIIGLTFFLKRA